MRGLIGVPHTGQTPWEFTEAVINLSIPEGCSINVVGMTNTVIHLARELFVATALQGGFDWLLMLDSDMVPEKDMIRKMLRHDVPVISAPCFKRVPPFTPCFYKRFEIKDNRVELDPFETWPENDLFQAQAVGAAAIMIKAGVLRAIPGAKFFPIPGCGEDISFCFRAREQKIPMWIDPTIRVGHVGSHVVYEEDYRRVGPWQV